MSSREFVVHTSVRGYASTVEIGKVASYKQLEQILQELLSLPISHTFEEGYAIERLQRDGSWAVLEEQQFEELKDGKHKVRLMERLVRMLSRIPDEADYSQDFIGINILSATIGKMKYEDVSVVVFLKKCKDDKWKTHVCNSQTPVWNENFCLPLHPEVITKDARLNEVLCVKVISSAREEQPVAQLAEKPSKTKKGEENKKDEKETKEKEPKKVKEDELAKFEIPLNAMKKGDPHTVTQTIKGGQLTFELRWFEDDRAIYETQRSANTLYHDSYSYGSFFYLPPPIDYHHITSKRREAAWYSDLRQLKSVADLRKGDVLIGKYFGSHPIVKAQKHTLCDRASKYSVHAAIVGEDGGLKVVEASEQRNKVSVSPHFPEADFLVYRAFDQTYAKEAGDWAMDIANSCNIAYSILGLTASIRYNEYDLAAQVRHKALATKKIVPKIMMPAQFVVACYQCRPETPYIRLNSLYISPMELEEYLNSQPHAFYFCGKISQSSVQRFNLDLGLGGGDTSSAFSPRFRHDTPVKNNTNGANASDNNASANGFTGNAASNNGSSASTPSNSVPFPISSAGNVTLTGSTGGLTNLPSPKGASERSASNAGTPTKTRSSKAKLAQSSPSVGAKDPENRERSHSKKKGE